MNKIINKLKSALGLKSKTDLKIETDKSINITTYINKRYERTLRNITNIYGDNHEILNIKEKLASAEIVNSVNPKQIYELKNSIQRVKEFITNVEIPAYEQIIIILNDLAKIDTINSESSQLLYQIKSQLIELKNSDNYNILKAQKNALEENNLQEYQKWYNLQIKINSQLQIFIPTNNSTITNYKTKLILPIAATIALNLLLITTSLNDVSAQEIKPQSEKINSEISKSVNTTPSNIIKASNVREHISIRRLGNIGLIFQSETGDKSSIWLEENIPFRLNNDITNKLNNANNALKFLEENHILTKKYEEENKKLIIKYKELIEQYSQIITTPVIFYDEYAKHIKRIQNSLSEHISSKEFLNKLELQIKRPENAKKYQLMLLQNLNTVNIILIDTASIKKTAKNKSVSAIYLLNNHVILLPYNDLNEEYILHELIHAAYGNNILKNSYALLKSSFSLFDTLNTTNNLFDSYPKYSSLKNKFTKSKTDTEKYFLKYLSSPVERMVGKTKLDMDMKKLGIKKYGEPFTKDHYKQLMNYFKQNKLSTDSYNFLKTTKPEDLIKIMNLIALDDSIKPQNKS
ncbi:MAG: hypothetical protein WC758_06225 [Candidatus Woesearchaeota archaeon]|jgi:hypothetical protein